MIKKIRLCLVWFWHSAVAMCASPSAYLMLLAALSTAFVKAHAVKGIIYNPFAKLWFSAFDIAVYMLVAAAFSYFEWRNKNNRIFTYPLSLVVCIFAAANAAYLYNAGEQVAWETVTDLFDRHGELWMIVNFFISNNIDILIIIAAGIFLLPLVIWLLLVDSDPHYYRNKTLFSVGLCLAAVIFSSIPVLESQNSVAVKQMRRNALLFALQTYNLSESHLKRGFEAWSQDSPVTHASLNAFKQSASRPNVLMVILESTGYDYTSLAGNPELMLTPALESLAQDAYVAHNMRAVMPHTSKSLFSLHCGQYPTMQREGNIENDSSLKLQCIPDVLRQAGYNTAFFQSADGVFEARPRLVNKFGYQTFRAWEDIKGDITGYFSSDDRSLIHPLREWVNLQVAAKKPFMATVLTSSTHHPYSRGIGKFKTWNFPKPRYKKLIKESDALLADIVAYLKAKNIYDNTVIIVLGDHGEGFNDHGVLQHDNNFYEEGLKVPFVIRGPAVPAKKEYGNASLLDLPSTLLYGVLGLEQTENSPLVGGNLLSKSYDFADKKYFGCFSHLRCRGYVQGSKKVLHLPNDNMRGYFDLASDKHEQVFVEIERNDIDLWSKVEGLDQFIYRNLAEDSIFPLTFYKINYGKWFCVKDKMLCYHPTARDAKYRFAKAKLRYDDDMNLIEQ